MKNPEMVLKRIRQARGLSIRALAEQAGVHDVTLARIEAEIYDPRLTTLRKLAGALGATVALLVSNLLRNLHKKEERLMRLTKRKDGW